MKNIMHDFRYGKILYNIQDRYIGHSLALYGEYSPDEVDIYKQILREGDTIVEVGANIGSITVPLSQFVGETGKVIAFEPQRTIFQSLCANVALNSITNAYTYNMGVSDTNTNIYIEDKIWNFPEHNSGEFEMKEMQQGYRVQVVTLDSFLADLKDLRAIKIDAEGMEAKIIKGASELIRRYRPVICIERNLEAISILKELGYEIHLHCVPLFSENNFFGNHKNFFTVYDNDTNCAEIICNYNWICVPLEEQWNLQDFPLVQGE